MAKYDGTHECEIEMAGTLLRHMNLHDKGRPSPGMIHVIQGCYGQCESIDVTEDYAKYPNVLQDILK